MGILKRIRERETERSRREREINIFERKIAQLDCTYETRKAKEDRSLSSYKEMLMNEIVKENERYFTLKGIHDKDIAKLEASKESILKDIMNLKAIIEQKDREIERLEHIVNSLITGENQ